VVVAFIDMHKDRFGVEPICTVLAEHGCGIAPSTYYAAKCRPRSARRIRDDQVLTEIRRVHGDSEIGRGLYGVRKVWRHPQREHRAATHVLGPVPRCQVERRMCAHGRRGVRRGKKCIMTKPDKAVPRAPDLVKRNFGADEPNRLWVIDLTYVSTWEQMAYTAFVSDVCSRRIVGWRTRGIDADRTAARRAGDGDLVPGTQPRAP
jgi:putative transposase